MWFIVFVLAVSTAFAAVCAGVSSFGNRPGRAALLALLAVVPAVLSISGPWILQALATAVLGGLLWLLTIRSKWAIASAVLLPLAGVYVHVLSATAQVNTRLDALRERYPVVSLEARLDYEQDRTPSVDSAISQSKLADDVESRLTMREEQSPFSFHRRGLEALHGDVSEEFIRASGFGIYRMPTLTRMINDPVEPKPIPLAAPSSEPYPSADPQVAAAGPAEAAAPRAVARPTKGQAYATHMSAEQEFLDRERMGYAESRRRTVGFEPHGFVERAWFRDLKKAEYETNGPINPDWTIVRLELVSLLKHDPPAAYVSENLPRMDELKDAPMRPLDPFERSALPKLRRDDDVVIEESAGSVRMLGALRAGNDCLACHRGSRGDLLGAFSYELRPTRPAAAPAVKKTSPQASVPRVNDRSLAAVVRDALPPDRRRQYR